MDKHYEPRGVNNHREIITIKEARKLLGQISQNLTNEELVTLIRDTETVVRVAVRTFIGSKNSKISDKMEVEL